MSDPIAALNRALQGRYDVEREAGAGGMATVYVARDVKHDRRVALKVLRPELASSLGADRFLREIQFSARLTHPHILTLIDSGQAADTLFFVLPYVEGESLREKLEREGPLAVEEAVRITSQVASALSYAHEEGVIHRDVKPENVLMHRGEAQVSDFGIAMGLQAAQDRLTRTGFSVGSPAYMSPEQADEGGVIDQRSDIYALGCLAYEMLTGRTPFKAESTRALVAQILTGAPKPLDDLRRDAPPGVVAAVHRALAKDPDDRFGDAEAFAEALRRATVVATAPAGTSALRRPAVLVALALVVALATGLAWRVQRAQVVNLAVEGVEAAISNRDMIEAFRQVRALPGWVSDTTRARLLAEVGVFDTLITVPAGALVSWRPILQPEAGWEVLGRTPLATHFPTYRGGVLLELELDGYETRHVWSGPSRDVAWKLRLQGEEPANALWHPGGTVRPGVLAGGIWHGDDREIGEYLIDRFEVTNREYQEFVDAGGYANPEWWTEEIVVDGRVASFEEPMARFVDRTGRAGPSTWEIGRFPQGSAELPVTGVSWYEAVAYARFRGRALPTMYHWYDAAAAFAAESLVPLSNFAGGGPAPGGAFAALTWGGVSDLGGNVREWVRNAAGQYRMSQGGGWSDPQFSFALGQPLLPTDRSEQNGFRLVTDLGDPEMLARAGAPVGYYERDFSEETPVSDDVFRVFQDLFAYDRTPLNVVVEEVDTLEGGVVRERVSFDAAYDGPRMVLHLFLPAEPRPEPLQAVVYFPGSGALNVRTFAATSEHQAVGVVTRSGRALAFPVYLATYERDDHFVYQLQDESNDYRDHVIKWYQDLARSVDYLETRPEIDADRLAYLGSSWGGRMGVIMLALEPRFKAGVLNVAGLSPKPTQSAVDPFHFAPRVRTPVRMLSGQFDPIYPLEMSALPLYRVLGAPEKDHYVSAGAHFVPYPEFAQQTLDWLDRHLGPVR